MEVDSILRLAVVLLLLFLSGFFSSVESAYFSLTKGEIDRLGESGDPRARRVVKLMRRPQALLAAILTANTIVNTAIAALTALLAVELAEYWNINVNIAVIVDVILITAIILFFGELIPKLQALRNPTAWALRTASLVEIVKIVSSPIAVPLAGFAGNIAKLFGIERNKMLALSEEELRALVQVGHKHGALDSEERDMIHSIFEFGDTIAREVMVPRMDMVAVEKGTALDELLSIVRQYGHSRLPVYDGKVDNIIGVVHVKELLAAVAEPELFDLTRHLRPAYFVPEEKKIDDLLREFQSEKVHMAVVVDEYGGTSGIVTLEDIIEEIVGEIQDEFDKEQPLIQNLDEKALIVNGKTPIYDLNEHLKSVIIEESDAYDTVAGYVYSRLGRVPRRGDQFEHNGYKFQVEELFGKRIVRVKIERLETNFSDV
ncbi:MAG: HlyC/CorC family transporter [Calditrichaeota bacterium]|nr:HlyC/CorC family transporter [Calditrichota bacterium]